jgi:peptide/nickel transport system substrate-binding protein
MSNEKSRKILVIAAMAIVSGTAFAGCFGPPPPPPQNQAPFAAATESANLVSVGDSVSFAATGQDTDGTIATWKWDFGDGTNATTQNATHTFTHQGNYYVTLNVTDNGGATYDTVRTGIPLRVTVLAKFAPTTPEDQPLAALSLWSASTVIKPGNSVAWSAVGSSGSWNADATNPGTITLYAMDFGDGSAAVTHDNVSLEGGTWDGNFSHTYADAGKFVAKLTVTSNTSKTDIAMWTVVSIASAPTPGLKNPDTLIIETISGPSSMDPAIAYDDASGQIIQAVYETLLTYHGSSADTFDPLLAEQIPTIANGGITNNNLTYSFDIKHGIKFSSGDTLDADDVVYSIKRVISINDPGSPAWILTQVLNDSSVVATDSDTVAFTLTQPYGAFLSTLAYTVAAVVSKSTVEAHGGTVPLTQNVYMRDHMDGTGPWVLNSWVSGQQIVLDKNPNYWNASGAAKLNHVIIAYKNEFSTRLIELRNGDADIIYVPGTNRPEIQAIAANAAEKISIESGASTWSITTGAFNFNINTTNRSTVIGAVNHPDNVPSDFFQDAMMRKAFALAFDYNDYITNVAKGLAYPLVGVIPRGMYGYDASLVGATFDLNGAKAAYDQTQWVTNSTYNPAGKAGGFNLTIGYNCGNTNREKMSLILQRGVEQLGPNVFLNVKCFEFAVYLSLTLQTASHGPGPIGMFFIGWGPDYADPDDYVVPFVKTGGTYGLYTGFSNSTLDAKLAEAAAIPNSATRLQLYHEIQESVVNNNVYIYVSEAKNFHVQKTWVKGWYANPMISGSDLGSNMANIFKE